VQIGEDLHNHTISLLEALRTFRFCSAASAPQVKPWHEHSLIAKITGGGTSHNVVRDSNYNIGAARPVR
jgi:hypothetical protein